MKFQMFLQNVLSNIAGLVSLITKGKTQFYYEKCVDLMDKFLEFRGGIPTIRKDYPEFHAENQAKIVRILNKNTDLAHYISTTLDEDSERASLLSLSIKRDCPVVCDALLKILKNTAGVDYERFIAKDYSSSEHTALFNAHENKAMFTIILNNGGRLEEAEVEFIKHNRRVLEDELSKGGDPSILGYTLKMYQELDDMYEEKAHADEAARYAEEVLTTEVKQAVRKKF